tara:strand:+ start:3086 stop:3334 length:249 start_codon:yes stop_codon:yes gene_type:complete
MSSITKIIDMKEETQDSSSNESWRSRTIQLMAAKPSILRSGRTNITMYDEAGKFEAMTKVFEREAMFGKTMHLPRSKSFLDE